MVVDQERKADQGSCTETPKISIESPEQQTDGTTQATSPSSETASSSFGQDRQPAMDDVSDNLSSKAYALSHKKNESRGQNLLAVPGVRSRDDSISSTDDQSFPSVSADAEAMTENHKDNLSTMSDPEALKPDPGSEGEFEVHDNKFSFSPGQLNKLINPKSLPAFYALGGLNGLERGLRTNCQSGLSMNETGLQGNISFEDAVQANKGEKSIDKANMTETSMLVTSPSESSNGIFSDRKRIFRDNRLPQKKSKSIWQLAWIAYNDKVLMVLTAAAVISLALGIYQSLGPADTTSEEDGEEGEAKIEWVEGVAIVVAILVVVLVGATNDWKKERQFVQLNRKKEERFVKVVRSGKSQEISVYDVLVGDVLHLEPGDLIPADGILIEGHNLKCDESSATGESDIIKKTPADQVYRAIENNESLSQSDPFILSGGKVAEGLGTFLVTSVGVYSSYGKILTSLQDEAQTTPLQSKLNVLAEYIAKLGLAAGLSLFVVLFIKFLAQLGSIDGPEAKGQAFLQIFIVAVTIVVVAVPEGLPLAVTLALAFATTRMLRDNNLVRLLRACETMGNATTICSDKTGTLTQNKMSVVTGTVGTSARFTDIQTVVTEAEGQGEEGIGIRAEATGMTSSKFTNELSSDVKALLKDSITLNTTAFEAEEGGKPIFVGSKTETALLDFGRVHLGISSLAQERANAQVAQKIPFNSGRKCMAVVVKLSSGKYRMYVKGASEILLARCTKVLQDPNTGADQVVLTNEHMEILQATIKNYASRSLRTIGLLYRDFDQWPPRGAPTQQNDAQMADFDAVFEDMVFLGVVGIQDPLRPGVAESVRQCQIAGVFVRMVTGDNLMTAKAIASECGIFTPGGIAMEGPVFRKLNSKQILQIIPRLQVLARSSPEDKSKLVKHLRKLGETVAVTGDGTNDAPALKAADVGFSMGIAGTEVAKEASAIILMDDNFTSIVKAVSWGRTVNDAVKKFLQVNCSRGLQCIFHRWC